MPLPPALLLIFYPLVGLFAPVMFYSLWPKMRPMTPNFPVRAEAAKEAAARLGTAIPFFAFSALMMGTLLWQAVFSVDLSRIGLFRSMWLSSMLIGTFLGMSWGGISIWLLALGAATGRMRREIPGLWAPLSQQIAVWLLGAVAEESWRVIAIAALASEGYSTVSSVIAVSLAFGSGHLRMGFQRTSIAVLEGMVLGFLFVWRGSLLVPLTAHLAVQAVYLWGVGQLSQGRESRKTWQISGTKCPVCHAQLKLLQLKLNDVFECPSCKVPLSVSDTYQNVMRFTEAFGFCSLIFGTIYLLHLWFPDRLVWWLTYPVSYGAATSLLFVYRRAFTRIFPPPLQRGTPYFVTLNLKGPPAKASSAEDEDKSFPR